MDQKSKGNVNPTLVGSASVRILGLGCRLRVRESRNKAGPGLKTDLNLRVSRVPNRTRRERARQRATITLRWGSDMQFKY